MQRTRPSGDAPMMCRAYKPTEEKAFAVGKHNAKIRSKNSAGVSEWKEFTFTVAASSQEEAETFRYVFPQEIVDGLTHTITLPVAWLAGAADPAEVTVELSGKDYQEAEVADNRFVIRLREEPLVFVRQPADMTVLMGETVQFQAEASGGAFPYAYRWQIAQEKPAHGRMWQGRGKQFCL